MGFFFILHLFECLSSLAIETTRRERTSILGGGGGGGVRVGAREGRVRVYLCCVSCHLCVRAHHRNCEACAHTSTITPLPAERQHPHQPPNCRRHTPQLTRRVATYTSQVLSLRPPSGAIVWENLHPGCQIARLSIKVNYICFFNGWKHNV